MENKLTLEHLAPYLPYGLQLWHPGHKSKHIFDEPINKGVFERKMSVVTMTAILKGAVYKPILRPMSQSVVPYDNVPYNEDGSKEPNYLFINENGIVCLDFQAGGNTICWGIKDMNDYIQGFFKNHFDVFGLIKKGLAVDINTIENA